MFKADEVECNVENVTIAFRVQMPSIFLTDSTMCLRTKMEKKTSTNVSIPFTLSITPKTKHYRFSSFFFFLFLFFSFTKVNSDQKTFVFLSSMSFLVFLYFLFSCV